MHHCTKIIGSVTNTAEKIDLRLSATSEHKMIYYRQRVTIEMLHIFIKY